MRDPVVITGIGLITPLAVGRQASWELIKRGCSGTRLVRLVTGETVVGGPSPLQGNGASEGISDRAQQMALLAAREAIQDAGLHLHRLAPERVGCVLGATGCPSAVAITHAREGNVTHWMNSYPNMTAATVARRLGLHGPVLSPAAACATGLFAVLRAAQCLVDGTCDVVLAGSSDASLDIFTVSGFERLRVLAQHAEPEHACRPFDRNRCGFVVGEGAAVFVLERLSRAVRRGAFVYAVLEGGILGSDAYHVTGLNPDPSGVAELIRRCLRRARLAPRDVDYINAHGTATKVNDLTEAQAIRLALGKYADSVKVSATKSMIGHLICAAGGVELAITALAVADGYIPPTANVTDPDPECAIDCTPIRGVAKPIDTALKLSIAFGGHFGAAILRHPRVYGLATDIRRAA